MSMRNLFANNFRHAFEGVDLDAFAGTDEQSIAVKIGDKQANILAHTLRWCHEQEQFFAHNSLGKCGGDLQRVGEVDSWQEEAVFTPLLHLLSTLGVVFPQSGTNTLVGQ